MKLFKSVDEKLQDMGFIKVRDDEHAVTYERNVEKFNYIQVVDILHKKSGRHIVQSYDKNLMDENNIGNVCVGLTYKEIKLIAKKMKQKGWYK